METALHTAAAYIRVSTEDQAEYSPDAQLKALRRYADEHGFLLPKKISMLTRGSPAARRKNARPMYELKDWPSGVVRCSACGGTLVFAKPHFFICNNYVRGSCRKAQCIRIDLPHDAVLGRLEQDLRGAGRLAVSVEYTGAKGGDELGQAEAQISGLRGTIDHIRAQASPEALDALLRQRLAAACATLAAPDASLQDKNKAIRNVVDRCIFGKAAKALDITYKILL